MSIFQFFSHRPTPATRALAAVGGVLFVLVLASYYVGWTHELNLLGDARGIDLEVTQLPAGPGGSAGPPLTTTAFMINAMSSEGHIARSLDLARFVTSSEQQSA